MRKATGLNNIQVELLKALANYGTDKIAPYSMKSSYIYSSAKETRSSRM